MTTEQSPRPRYVHARLIETFGPLKGFREEWKPWTPPKLSENGREFKPKHNRPGDEVVFEAFDAETGERKRLKGQVWSEGPRQGTLWVVRDGEAYLV